VKFTGLSLVYRYKLTSPLLNPTGSSLKKRPSYGS
jgi:hypothetical protein